MDGFDFDFDLNYSKECCGEIYILQKRYLVFHCVQCSKELTEFKSYLKHISKHYVHYSEEPDCTELPQYSGKDSMTIPEVNKNCSEQNGDDHKLVASLAKEEMHADAESENAENLEDRFEYTGNMLQETEDVDDKTEDMNDDTKVIDDQKEDTEDDIICIEDDAKGVDMSKFSNVKQLHEGKVGALQTCSILKLRETLLKESLEPISKTHTTNSKIATTATANKKRKFECEDCGSTYTNKNHLRAHIRREHNTCKYCLKWFDKHCQMVYHQRIHTGEKPFLCSHCGSGFPTASRLTEHMKRHTNQRSHKCTECGKKFYERRDLRDHKSVHTKERNFSCNVCSRRFCRNKTLQQHMKIHANLRKYVCHICQQSFNQGPGLRAHLLNKHKLCNVIEETS